MLQQLLQGAFLEAAGLQRLPLARHGAAHQAGNGLRTDSGAQHVQLALLLLHAQLGAALLDRLAVTGRQGSLQHSRRGSSRRCCARLPTGPGCQSQLQHSRRGSARHCGIQLAGRTYDLTGQLQHSRTGSSRWHCTYLAGEEVEGAAAHYSTTPGLTCTKTWLKGCGTKLQLEHARAWHRCTELAGWQRAPGHAAAQCSLRQKCIRTSGSRWSRRWCRRWCCRTAIDSSCLTLHVRCLSTGSSDSRAKEPSSLPSCAAAAQSSHGQHAARLADVLCCCCRPGAGGLAVSARPG